MKTFDIKKILVPVDFSETSLNALNHAVHVAKINSASITLVNVVESMYPYVAPVDYPASSFNNLASYEKEVLSEATIRLNKLGEQISKKDNVVIKSITLAGWMREEVLDTAKEYDVDIIIMGTHGVKGFREFIIGSNAFRIINEAKCPVLTIRKKTDIPGFKNIIVPFRDKPHSREKVDYAIRMAQIYGAAIHVLGVETEANENHLNKIVLETEQMRQVIEKSGLKCSTKVKSSKYLVEEVLKYAKEENADLIVIMADLDRERISELFMGPFSQQMVNHSSIPVLSIRPTDNPEAVSLHGSGW